ncbi:hypothetical protein H6G00_00795 [Leptolyngbya sp. FACHB-541]|uniref:hypothetical protein n=1 Tax=Leptolyngbya sp. FACHB-541 TaxID=2692810 RepID=UPI0016896A91|nr:hypothetical protein [Leptolyngbya sp. FACHB-541]MBD1995165.1 hypothetical protein [Leptolyngbya sp. FACHB-541]
MGIWQDFVGTTEALFRVGLTGFSLKNNGGNVVVRNSGDTADAELTASQVKVSGDSIVINSDAANAGNDRSLTLQRATSGMTGALTVILPALTGADGQVLAKKAGSPAGVLELELISAANTALNTANDTTALAFGSAATVPMFTLPANAIIQSVETVVDVTFNGTPSISVGISGNASKYVASTQVDLKAAARTSFVVHPAIAPSANPENLEIAYSAGGATAGAARVIVAYTIPA